MKDPWLCSQCDRVLDLCDCPSVVEKQLKDWADHWEKDSCVKCGKEFLFFKGNRSRRCSECEKEGVNISSEQYKELLAKHDRLVKMLEVAEAVLRFYADQEEAYFYPEKWKCFKQHESPTIDDYDRFDIGEPARTALFEIERLKK